MMYLMVTVLYIVLFLKRMLGFYWWLSLPRAVVDVPLLEVFKARLELWASWSCGRCPSTWQWSWNSMIFKVPSIQTILSFLGSNPLKLYHKFWMISCLTRRLKKYCHMSPFQIIPAALLSWISTWCKMDF